MAFTGNSSQINKQLVAVGVLLKDHRCHPHSFVSSALHSLRCMALFALRANDHRYSLSVKHFEINTNAQLSHGHGACIGSVKDFESKILLLANPLY